MTQVRLGSRDSLRFISEINVRVRVMIMFRPGFVYSKKQFRYMSKINGRLRVGLSLGLVTELLPFLKFMLQLGEGLRLKLGLHLLLGLLSVLRLV